MKLNSSLIFRWACFVWGMACFCGSVRAETAESFIVNEVVVKSQGGLSESRVKELFSHSKGDEVTLDARDKGMKRISHPGRSQGLGLRFDRVTGRIVIVAEAFDLVEDVTVVLKADGVEDAQRRLLVRDVRDVSAVNSGDQISLEQLPEIRSRIQKRLSDRGFLNSKVILALQEKEDSLERELSIEVEAGKQEFLSTFSFEGFDFGDIQELRSLFEEEDYSKVFLSALDVPSQLLDTPEEYFLDRFNKSRDANRGKKVDFEIRFPYDRILINNKLNEWGKRVRQEGYFEFELQSNFIRENGKDSLEVKLDRGPQYNIQFYGNVNFWERNLRSKVLERPSKLGIPFNVGDAREIVMRLYKAEGFKDVEVRSEIEDSVSQRTIRFTINEGRRYYLGNIVWGGPGAQRADELGEIELAWRQGLSSPFSRPYFDDKVLKSQMPRLLGLIRDEGFLQARFLGYSSEISRSDVSNEMDLLIPIQLGPRFEVASFNVDGEHPLLEEEVSELVSLEIGERASASKILESAAQIEGAIRERGFLMASVSKDLNDILQYSDSEDEVSVSFFVNRGPEVRLGQIVVEGLRRVDEKVILREFEREELNPLSPWIPSKMERIDERLLGYGLFNNLRYKSIVSKNIQLNTADGTQEVQERDLRLILSERPGGALEFGPGYRTELGLIAFGEFNYRNLMGMNRSMVLRAQVSRKLQNYQFPEQRYSITFLEPYLFGFPTSARISTSYEKRDEIQVANDGTREGFNAEQASVSLDFIRELTDTLRLRLNAYTLLVPRIFDIQSTDTTVDRLTYRIATVGPQFVWDRRDNIFNPSSGVLWNTQIDYSGPRIGSGEGVHFLRLINEFNHYTRLRPGIVLATSVGYSHMRALGDATSIPENIRLVSGGRTTIRSLQERSIRYDQSAVANMSSYLLKTELRQVIYKDIGLAAFLDIGRVDAENYVGEGWREAAGFGLRYQTAVGPLSLDFAFNLDQRTGEDFYRVLFSVGVF